jgi:intracellular septation protein
VTKPTTPPSPLFRLGLDIGPLAVFFLVNTFAGGPPITRALTATAAFMVAIAVAMGLSRWRLGTISPMLWLSGGLVLVFGALTLLLHDTTFIKVKPSIVYAMMASLLGFGLATNRPMLKWMLEAAYPGLTDAGWRKLTQNWAIFFVVMAITNEVAWRTLAPGDDLTRWAAFKLYAVIPATLIFALANVPMLMRHGLMADPPVPPEG